MASHPARPTRCQIETEDEILLHDSVRWVSATVPVGSGRHSISVDSFWGNASEEPQALGENA